ncbi:hypothetical protein C8R44DRAFT_739262 [Mycena epipterygia]|nr:hypothetical protein C8R44DRAFT_739262 [Mycena epipterygia]
MSSGTLPNIPQEDGYRHCTLTSSRRVIRGQPTLRSGAEHGRRSQSGDMVFDEYRDRVAPPATIGVKGDVFWDIATYVCMSNGRPGGWPGIRIRNKASLRYFSEYLVHKFKMDPEVAYVFPPDWSVEGNTENGGNMEGKGKRNGTLQIAGLISGPRWKQTFSGATTDTGRRRAL